MFVGNNAGLLKDDCDCDCGCCELISWTATLLDPIDNTSCSADGKVTWKFNRPDRVRGLSQIQVGTNANPLLCWDGDSLTITVHPPVVSACGKTYFFKQMRITWGCNGEFTTGWIPTRTYTIDLPNCVPPEKCTIALEAQYERYVFAGSQQCSSCAVAWGTTPSKSILTATVSGLNWGAWSLGPPWSSGCGDLVFPLLEAVMQTTFPIYFDPNALFVPGTCVGGGCQCAFVGGSQVIVPAIEPGGFANPCGKQDSEDTFTHYQVAMTATVAVSYFFSADNHLWIQGYLVTGGATMFASLAGPPGVQVGITLTKCATGVFDFIEFGLSEATGAIDMGEITTTEEFCKAIVQFYTGKSASSTPGIGLANCPDDSGSCTVAIS